MKFAWKLFPLQRKLAWDLDLAQGRLAVLLRGYEHAGSVLRALEKTHADQSGAALAAAQRRTDPARHGQALAYLAGMEARLLRARTQRTQLEAEIAVARADCCNCNRRLKAVETLHNEALAEFTHAARRHAGKEADLAWLARTAGSEAE